MNEVTITVDIADELAEALQPFDGAGVFVSPVEAHFTGSSSTDLAVTFAVEVGDE
jgi:hypothetical protein